MNTLSDSQSNLLDIPRRAHLSSWRALNSSLDTVFYDVTSLSRQERESLKSHTQPEGSILIVGPGSSGSRIRSVTPLAFVEEQRFGNAESVETLAVAGVGSTATGTAALARNVADHLGRPVAGIVSGFGMADLLSEALGGWFVLGGQNILRDGYARVFDALGLKDHVRDPASHEDLKNRFLLAGLEKERFIYGSPDSTALLYLMLSLGTQIKLVVGHSKGNYSIANAVEGRIEAGKKGTQPMLAMPAIVTFGAVVRFPPECTQVHQFIGGVDVLGMINSRPLVDRTTVTGSWHTLNTQLPGHLSVGEALESAGYR